KHSTGWWLRMQVRSWSSVAASPFASPGAEEKRAPLPRRPSVTQARRPPRSRQTCERAERPEGSPTGIRCLGEREDEQQHRRRHARGAEREPERESGCSCRGEHREPPVAREAHEHASCLRHTLTSLGFGFIYLV